MNDDTPRKKRLPLRWLTLAEVVGIAALTIAGLSFWDSHRERANAERDQRAAAQTGAMRRAFLLTAAPDDSGDRLKLTTVNAEQVIQTQALSFPSEVRGGDVQTTGNPRIEAGWIDSGLAKAAKFRRQKAASGRVPVAVVTTFIEDGQTKTDRALYTVGYSLHPRMLRDDKVELEGLSLVRRGLGDDVRRAVDAAWARQNPPPAKP